MIETVYSQPLIVREKWGSKNIHIGLNDPNSESPPNNWLLTFGRAPSNDDFNFGMWGIGMLGNGLNINRINSGNVPNPGNGILYISPDWKFGLAVGAALDPQYTLDVRGSAIANNWLTRSDQRLKKDIKPMDVCLNKILSLNSITYKNLHKISSLEELYKPQGLDTLNDYLKRNAITEIERQKSVASSDTTTRFGFIAQELKEIYPELVFEDSKGYLSVNYIGLIPVLVESIKELQNQINELKQTKPNTNTISNAILYQNTPNPFTQNTEISYYLPETSQNAIIAIYDLSGTQIKQFNLTTKGNSKIIINGNEFKPGMYLYALLVDGKEIDTKKMILTQ